MEKAFAIPISRRDFMKLAGLTAASSLLGSKDDAAKAEAASPAIMLMYGKEASNRKQEIDRQHYTIPNQRPKDKHCGKI